MKIPFNFFFSCYEHASFRNVNFSDSIRTPFPYAFS